MLYLSDHGKSLGEYGIYLHGTPYSIAPKYQKEIPFFIWESKMFLEDKGLKAKEIKKQNIYGQYDVFHTILGAFDINSSIYNKNKDLFYIGN